MNEGRHQRLGGEVVDRPGEAACGVVHQGHGVVGEHPVRSPRQLQVVGDAGGGLGELHAVEVVAQNDALVQARERAESEQKQSYERGAIPSASALTGYRGRFRSRQRLPK